MSDIREINAGGSEDLINMLNSLPMKIQARLLKRMQAQVGSQLVSILKDRAPVDRGGTGNTGDLRDSISAGKPTKSKSVIKLKITGKYYGKFTEFGTVYQTARPWVGPAMEDQGSAILSAIVDQLAQEIQREQDKL